jgi:hypothetical protein
MARKIAYWLSTGLVAAMSLFAGYAERDPWKDAVAGF